MPEDLPQPIGPTVDFVLRRTLLQKEFNDALQQLRVEARQTWKQHLQREIELSINEDVSPEAAGEAALEDLASFRARLESDLAEAIDREEERFHQKMQELLEGRNDEAA